MHSTPDNHPQTWICIHTMYYTSTTYVTVYNLSCIAHELSSIIYLFSNIHYPLSIICNLLSIIYFPRPMIAYQLPSIIHSIIHYLFSITYYLLYLISIDYHGIIYHLLSIIYTFLFHIYTVSALTGICTGIRVCIRIRIFPPDIFLKILRLRWGHPSGWLFNQQEAGWKADPTRGVTMGKMETVPESIIYHAFQKYLFFCVFWGGVATWAQKIQTENMWFPTKGQLNALMPMPRAFTSIQPVAISSWKMPMWSPQEFRGDLFVVWIGTNVRADETGEIFWFLSGTANRNVNWMILAAPKYASGWGRKIFSFLWFCVIMAFVFQRHCKTCEDFWANLEVFGRHDGIPLWWLIFPLCPMDPHHCPLPHTHRA